MHIVCNNESSRYAMRDGGEFPQKGRKGMKYGDRVLLKEYKNGNKLWGTVTKCVKCGTHGKLGWTDYADGICFDCGGKGWYYTEDREYTPENLAKKLAKDAAKRAAREAEIAAREAEIAAEEARREAERLAEIERNRGQFIGNEGDKIQMEVTFTKNLYYERPRYNAPWSKELVNVYIFKTEDGNTLVWKTTGALHDKEYREGGHFADKGGWYDYVYPEEGEKIVISGTIKGHEEYRNVNQTELNRVKWIRK